jgi:hypothetical protein
MHGCGDRMTHARHDRKEDTFRLPVTPSTASLHWNMICEPFEFLGTVPVCDGAIATGVLALFVGRVSWPAITALALHV